MTAPSSLVQPEKDLAARAVPHMSQSPFWMPIGSPSPMPIETRVSHDGLVWISGNYYSIPDHTRRIVEVQQLPDVIPFSIKAQSLPSFPFWRRPPATSRRARASTGGQPVQVATWRIRSPRRSGRRSHAKPVAGVLPRCCKRLPQSEGRPSPCTRSRQRPTTSGKA